MGLDRKQNWHTTEVLRAHSNIVMAAIALILAMVVAKDTAVLALRTRAPDLALALDQNDPVALANQFDSKFVLDQGSAVDARLEARARAALSQNPLSSGAARIIGLAREEAGDYGQARKLMFLSERISRRDSITQLWLIENWVAKGDALRTLDHYDRLLSVNPQSGQLLYPILLSALGDPDIRAGLVPFARRNRVWVTDFLRYSISNAADLDVVVSFFDEYGGSEVVAEHVPLETALIDRLVALGKAPQAVSSARRLARNEPNILNDFAMTTRSFNPALGPLGWTIGDTQGVDADLLGGAGLRVRVAGDARGIAAHRTMVLGAGHWNLSFYAKTDAEDDAGSIAWNARCLTGDVRDVIWTYPVKLSNRKKAYWAGFEIPAACNAITFQLVADGSGSAALMEIAVDGLRLRRQ